MVVIFWCLLDICYTEDSYVYATLDFESPPIFHDWFVFEHEIHDHSTRMSTELQQSHHFDVGVIQQTLKLQIKGSNNNYGKKKLLRPLVLLSGTVSLTTL